MLEYAQKEVTKSIKALFQIELLPQVSVPDEQFGDVASNVAMQLTKELEQPPREIAEQIAEHLRANPAFSEVSIAGPGFINIRYADKSLWGFSDTFTNTDFSLDLTDFQGVNYVLEYSCPNWFKELHTGHLYQTILGDALAKMLERAGAKVSRTTFGGDVGLHVAKALWSILADPAGYDTAKGSDPQQKASFITEHYVKGSQAYETDDTAKEAVRALNKKIYELHKDDSSHPDIRDIYFTCREWSTDYFHYFYKTIEVHEFDKYYPESSTETTGMEEVEKGLAQGVFERSDGAVVFCGEARGLHTRVFVTKENLPTYETKDLGVILLEKQDFGFERRVLITGSDQKAYMQVVWCALEEMDPSFKGTMQHLTNGIVKFADGSKMSSRLGNVTRAVDVLEAVRSAVVDSTQSDEQEKIVLGAIKYEFLKYSVGSDIAFDINESVSLKGNSGPYLQYARVRAQSILDKWVSYTEGKMHDTHTILVPSEDPRFNPSERKLVRKLAQFHSVFAESVEQLSPNTICSYLYELAQTFNQFYENNPVIGDEAIHQTRWEIVSRYLGVVDNGLELLGIKTPEKM